MASDSARREDHFQKQICPKRTFPSDFVKLVSEITLFIFGRQNGRLLLLFVATLSDFGLTFFFNLSIHRGEKDDFKEKIIRCTVWELLNNTTPKVPRFCRFTGFTKMQLT